MKGNALCSWSGGKDSCYALLLAQKQGYTPKVLLNVLNEEGKISRSHGIPSEILQAQAEAAALLIHMIISSWQEYKWNFLLVTIKYKTCCFVRAVVVNNTAHLHLTFPAFHNFFAG